MKDKVAKDLASTQVEKNRKQLATRPKQTPILSPELSNPYTDGFKGISNGSMRRRNYSKEMSKTQTT